MGEHVPFADRLRDEVDAFFRLWKNRRWLAVTLLVILLAYSLYSTVGWYGGAAKIQSFQSENRELQRDKQQLQSQLNSFNIAVAPLIERAGKEFPGEEINKSLKKIVDRLEKQNPLLQPIASATATVSVTIKADDTDETSNGHFMNSIGHVAFAKGRTPLLAASSDESWTMPTGKGEVQYRAAFTMQATDTAIGKPILFLKEAEYIQAEFSVMPQNSLVTGGEVVFVVNSTVRLAFTIPQQQCQERRFFIRNLVDGMKPLSSDK